MQILIIITHHKTNEFLTKIFQTITFPIAIKGASAGKKTMRKLSAHEIIILIGINCLAIELTDPSPKNLRTIITIFDSILYNVFGMFFIIFLDFSFKRQKKGFCTYIISKTYSGLYKLTSRSLQSWTTSSLLIVLPYFMCSLIVLTLV